jgi:hypothetical protein
MQKSNIIPAFSFVALFILLAPLCFTQNAKQYKIKKTIAKSATDSAKRHPFYNALVYFSGNGQSQVKMATFYSSDLPSLMKMIDSTSNGAIVTFDYLKYVNGYGDTKLITEIPYKFNKGTDTVKYESNIIKELKKLINLNFISGTVYFSGTYFPNVLITYPKGIESLNTYFKRCAPGTIVVFENCIYKNEDGSVSKPLSKSFKLE